MHRGERHPALLVGAMTFHHPAVALFFVERGHSPCHLLCCSSGSGCGDCVIDVAMSRPLAVRPTDRPTCSQHRLRKPAKRTLLGSWSNGGYGPFMSWRTRSIRLFAAKRRTSDLSPKCVMLQSARMSAVMPQLKRLPRRARISSFTVISSVARRRKSSAAGEVRRQCSAMG